MNNRVWVVFCFLLLGTIGVDGQESPGPQIPWVSTPSLKPGTFPSNRVLSVPVEGSWSYRFVNANGTPHTDFFLPFDGPIYLESPPSGRAMFRIQFKDEGIGAPSEPVSYIIDRQPPAVPVASVAPGTHLEGITILPETTDSGTRIWCLLSSRGAEENTDTLAFTAIDSVKGLTLSGAAGRMIDYTVTAYAEDNVGNRSPVTHWNYRIDRSGEIAPPSRILTSPVEGTFGNPQLLLVDDRALSEISVTVTSSDGTEKQFTYDGPQIISGEGQLSVTVTAIALIDRSTVSQSVSWQQTDMATSGDFPVSGMYHQTVTIPLRQDASELRYNLQDTPVSPHDPYLYRSLEIVPEPGLRRVVTFRSKGRVDDEEMRLLYVVDGRSLPAPGVVFHDDHILLQSLRNTEISYHFVPAATETYVPYGEPIPFSEIPSGATGIRVRTRYRGGQWSEAVDISLASHHFPLTSDQIGALAIRQEGALLHFELSGDTASSPDRPLQLLLRDTETGETFFSAWIAKRLSWRMPKGLQSSYSAAVLEPSPPDGSEIISTPLQRLDNAPPQPPGIIVTGSEIRLEGRGSIMYRVDRNEFQRYSSPFALEGVPGARVVQIIETYTVLAGETSPVVRRSVPVDRRTLQVPSVIGAQRLASEPGSRVDDAFISNEGSFTLRFANPHEDLLIYYEVGENAFPRLPAASSGFTKNEIALSVADGERKEFYLRLRARFQDREQWSALQTFLVVLDREPPNRPLFASPTGNSVEAQEGVPIRFVEPRQEGVRIWYRLSPDMEFRPYIAPFTLAAPADAGKSIFLVDAYAEDEAGNRSALERPLTIRFTADSISAPRFLLNGRPVSVSSVTVSREALIGVNAETDGDSIYWRLRRLDAIEADGFVPYQGEERIPMEEGVATRYLAEAYRINNLGRWSATARLTVILDPLTPDKPPTPYIIRDPQGERGSVVWPGSADRQIFASNSAGSSGFSPVEGAFSWSVPEGSDETTIQYFQIHEDGRRSETASLTIKPTELGGTPQFSGVTDGGVFISDQIVTLTGSGTIRYTLSDDGSDATPVHSTSPVYNRPITLSVPPGEDRTFRLRARAETENGTLSETAFLTVRIDRQLPAPPTLRDVESGDYLPDSTELHFDAPVDTSVYIRRSTGEEEMPVDFQEYTGAGIPLPAIDGRVIRYRIEGYTVDSAGNRSQTIAYWEVAIDREIIYIDAAAASPGSDQPGDGTREHPFSTFIEGLRLVRSGGRRTLFLTAGRYVVDPAQWEAAISAVPEVTIIGGLDGTSWRETDGTTILDISGDTGVLRLSGAARLQNLTFGNSISGVTVSGTSIRLANVSRPQSARLEFFVHSGDLHLSESTLPSIHSESTGTIRVESSQVGDIAVTVGSATVHNSTIGAVSVREDGLVELSNTDITNTLLRLGNPGDVREGLLVEDASVMLKDSVVRSDRIGAAPLVRVVNGSLEVVRSVIQTVSPSSQLSVLVHATDSNVTLRESYLTGQARDYNFALVARRSSVTVASSLLGLSGGLEQTGIVVTDGQLELTDSALLIRGISSNLMRALQITGTGDYNLENLTFLRDLTDGDTLSPEVRRSTSALERNRSTQRPESVVLFLEGGARIAAKELYAAGWEPVAGDDSVSSEGTQTLGSLAPNRAEAVRDLFRFESMSLEERERVIGPVPQ